MTGVAGGDLSFPEGILKNGFLTQLYHGIKLFIIGPYTCFVCEIKAILKAPDKNK